MPGNPKLTELQENGRLILLHIRRGALIFCLTAVGLVLAQFFADLRLWNLLAILGVLSITVVGDLIRYIRCEREMKRAQKERLLRRTGEAEVEGGGLKSSCSAQSSFARRAIM